MFPASSRGRVTKQIPQLSPSPLHSGGTRGSLDGLGPDGGSCNKHAHTSFSVRETERASELSLTTEEVETSRRSGSGSGHGLDGNSTTPRALVDDDDLNNALDGAMNAVASDAVATAVVEGEQEDDGVDGGEGSAVLATLGESDDGAGVLKEEPQCTTILAGATDNGTGGFDAKTEGDTEHKNRQKGRHRAGQPDATIISSSFVEAGDKYFSGLLGQQHGDDDGYSSASTELTLGRPDPTSVHWKFSRRLLQT